MDLDDGVAGVVLAGEQCLQFDPGDQIIKAPHCGNQVRAHLFTLPGQLEVGLGLFPCFIEVFGLGDGGDDPGPALLGLTGPVLVVPDLRVAQLLFDRRQAQLLVIDIKGTSAAPGPCPSAP
jgi:hypothetical protein